MQETRAVEVCFSPGLFQDILTTGEFIVVLVDILRATTTICTAVGNGVEAIIPVATHEEARRLKSEGFLVASEKDGVQVDFADFGNSAFSFTREASAGRRSSTARPTARERSRSQGRERHRDRSVHQHLGADGVAGAAAEERRHPVLGLEEQVLPRGHALRRGADERLLDTGTFRTECDSANAAMDLWSLAQDDVLEYVEKAAQRHRLKNLGLDDVIPYSFECDQVDVVPVFDGK